MRASASCICSTCGHLTPISRMRKDSSRPSGVRGVCLDCTVLRHTANRYQITVEEWQRLFDRQEGSCALCLEPPDEHRRLAVDHDHHCLEHEQRRACRLCIRGLLCNCCNRMLGLAERSQVVSAKFADYLASRPLIEGRAA